MPLWSPIVELKSCTLLAFKHRSTRGHKNAIERQIIYRASKNMIYKGSAFMHTIFLILKCV